MGFARHRVFTQPRPKADIGCALRTNSRSRFLPLSMYSFEPLGLLRPELARIWYDGRESATKGLGMFGVSYHETFDFFWIKGALRCKANNFLGYDFNQRIVGIFQFQDCSYPLECGRHIL